MSLEYLCRNAASSIGFIHLGYIEEIRSLLRRMTDEEFEKEVERIKDPKLLKILWEAGLTAERQKIVLKRLEELIR